MYLRIVSKMHKPSLRELPLRTLVIVFFTLSFLVVTRIFITRSPKSSSKIDVAMHIRTDNSGIRNVTNSVRFHALNGTINGASDIQTVSGQGYMSTGKFPSLLDIVSTKNLNEMLTVTDKIQRNIHINRTKVQYINTLRNTASNTASVTQRKDECNNCFNHNFKYIIDNPDICKLYSGQTEIELLIIILTVHKNVQQRNTLRETWLTYSKNNTASVRYVFLLGEINDAKLKAILGQENDLYRDIIKEDFADVYSNLTYKTIMGFKWAATKCSIAKAVLKTDDDVYMNVPNVLGIVRHNFTVLQRNIVGSCSKRERPIRDQNSKWFASVNSYPGKFYPGVCSGTGYLTSLNVAQKVFEVSPHVPYFHLEDVYVALCIKKLGYHLKGFPGFNPGRPKLDACLYNGKSLVTAHYMTPAMTRQMWKAKCVPRMS